MSGLMELGVIAGAVIGTVLYIASMWVNGILQGLMWRAYNQDGTLTYTFVESVSASYAGYVVRVIGGGIFFAGMLVMAYNVYRCWPSEFQAQADLDGTGNAILIQTLKLENEGWERDYSVVEPTQPSFTLPA